MVVLVKSSLSESLIIYTHITDFCFGSQSEP